MPALSCSIAENGLQAVANRCAVALAEAAELLLDESVVEREELESDDAGRAARGIKAFSFSKTVLEVLFSNKWHFNEFR